MREIGQEVDEMLKRCKPLPDNINLKEGGPELPPGLYALLFTPMGNFIAPLEDIIQVEEEDEEGIFEEIGEFEEEEDEDG